MALEQDGDLVALAREISTWLAATIAEQVGALQQLGLDTVLVVDEPGLAAAGLARCETSIWDPLRAVAPAWGLHLCCAVPWELVDQAEPDLLSFDLATHGLVAAAHDPLRRLAARGGRIVWGALDPQAPGGASAAAARIRAAVASLALAAVPGIVSPACGTGLLSEDEEVELARLVRAVADEVRGTQPAVEVRGAQPATYPASASSARSMSAAPL